MTRKGRHENAFEEHYGVADKANGREYQRCSTAFISSILYGFARWDHLTQPKAISHDRRRQIVEPAAQLHSLALDRGRDQLGACTQGVCHVERLVQEFDLDRAAILISTEHDENSAGEEQAGSDNPADRTSEGGRDDAALHGAIVVTAKVADEDAAEKVRLAFGEFDAEGVEEIEKAQA